MTESLIRFLETNRDAICADWQARLSDPAAFAAARLRPGEPLPLRGLFDDVLHALRQQPHDTPAPTVDVLRQKLGPLAGWRISLCQAVEVLLTGEVVLRAWTRTRWDAGDGELLEVAELINRVFHQLLRVYTLRYCDQCHALQGTREPIAEELTP